MEYVNQQNATNNARMIHKKKEAVGRNSLYVDSNSFEVNFFLWSEFGPGPSLVPLFFTSSFTFLLKILFFKFTSTLLLMTETEDLPEGYIMLDFKQYSSRGRRL